MVRISAGGPLKAADSEALEGQERLLQKQTPVKISQRSLNSRSKGLESDSDSDFDLDNIVSVSQRPAGEENEEEMPVEVTPLPETESKSGRHGSGRPLKSGSAMAQYRVIGVEDCERIAEELPSLGELGQILCLGVGVLRFGRAFVVLGFWAMAFCHWRFVPIS